MAAADLAAVLVVLVAANAWVHVGPRRAHLLTQPVAGVLLLALGTAWPACPGPTWASPPAPPVSASSWVFSARSFSPRDTRWLAVPALRGAFLDTRYDVGLRSALRIALVEIPLSTVLLEEIAFRGVVWGLLAADRGPVAATVVSSACSASGTCCPRWTSRARAPRSGAGGVVAAEGNGDRNHCGGDRDRRRAPGRVAPADRQPARAHGDPLGGQRDRRPRLRLGVEPPAATRPGRRVTPAG